MCLPAGRVHHFSKRGSALRFEQTEQRSALCPGSRGGCRHYRFRSFKNSICFAGAGHDGSLHSEAPAQCRCSHHPKPRRYSEAVVRRRGRVMTVLAMLELRVGSSRFAPMIASNSKKNINRQGQHCRVSGHRARAGFFRREPAPNGSNTSDSRHGRRESHVQIRTAPVHDIVGTIAGRGSL